MDDFRRAERTAYITLLCGLSTVDTVVAAETQTIVDGIHFIRRRLRRRHLRHWISMKIAETSVLLLLLR